MKKFDPEKLRYQMAMHGFNARTLSKASGVTENSVGRTLRGITVPHSDTLGKLIKAIGCDYNDLFTEEAPEKE